MRNLVVTAALGCLAMATAADAQIVETRPVECAFRGTDRDILVEVARLDLPSLSGPALT